MSLPTQFTVVCLWGKHPYGVPLAEHLSASKDPPLLLCFSALYSSLRKKLKTPAVEEHELERGCPCYLLSLFLGWIKSKT